jgi:hypothetical protein
VSISRVFVGFAADPPLLAEAIRSAAKEIDNLPDVDVVSWENFRIGGTVLLETVEREIRAASVSILDLTELNENVLFELGLAVGSDKVVWPLRDASITTRQQDWKALGIFDTLGQIRFTNSQQIYAKFLSERPDVQGEPVFSNTFAENIVGGREPSLLYIAETHQTDAGRSVLRVLESERSEALPLVVDDPNETSVQTVAWYVQQVYSAEVVVVHLASHARSDWPLQNARASFIAGLARGMRRPLLILAEEGHESALDYKDLLYRYPSAAECGTRTSYWLRRELGKAHEHAAAIKDERRKLELSTELRSVDLGEYVAENEASGLSRYYIETATFREVLSGASRVYVGSKGSGKSATAMQTAEEIEADKRDLACVIKPAGYDLDGLVRLLERYEERDIRGYLAESLWKFLLGTELALAVERDLANRAAGVVPSDPEWALLEYVAENEHWTKADFATRLERVVDAMLSTPKGSSIATERTAISEALHAGPLSQLRAVLGPALEARRRSFIIIDNVDKAWDAGANAHKLARVILGLLSCMDGFRHDLAHSGGRRDVEISLSLFIRSDIFRAVAAQAREPDKLPVRHLVWEEELQLLDVPEERYAVSRPAGSERGELWRRFFCESVQGTPLREWLLAVCVPRPRDLLYLCRAAIDRALTARHSRVEPDDLLAAERQYSLFAFEAVAVECQQRFAKSEAVLLEFAGVPTSLTDAQLSDVLAAAEVPAGDHQAVTDALRDVGFLGIVTGDSGASFAEAERDKQKADVLSRRRGGGTSGERRFEIRRAYWAYLELEKSSRTLNLGV